MRYQRIKGAVFTGTVFWAAFTVLFAGSVARAASESKAVPPTIQPSPDPDPTDPKRTYEYCIELSQTRPEQSIELAGKWIALGGGEPALHCKAMSLIGLQSYGEGATELEGLAQKSHDNAQLRAGMLEQAGQAWILEGELGHAYAAQTAGLKIVPPGTPLQVVLFVDRAGVLAESEKYQEAASDLDAALKIDPDNGDALAFRASARRHLGQLDLGLVDADHAVKSNPKNVTALLERADIYRIKERLTDARRDWVQVIRIAPDSDAARAARENIEKLDIKPDEPK